MQRLNIPLHRYQHTTRLSRRVVSVSVFLGSSGVLLVFCLGIWWFQRDTTSHTAPVGTTMVVHFTPNQTNSDAIMDIMRNFPLISNRSLTFTDMQPYIQGEFSLFIAEDGTRSVAIRSKTALLPMKTFDQLGILVENVGKRVFLLSDRPVARDTWSPPHNILRSLHFPTKQRIAELYEIESEWSGVMYVDRYGLTIRSKKNENTQIPLKYVPKNTIAALATPALPNMQIQSLLSLTDATMLGSVLNTAGYFILTKTENEMGFLISSSSKNFDKEQQQKIIQQSASFKQPIQQLLTLPDDSKAQEIIIDSGLSTIEETTISGMLVSRVATSGGSYLYSLEKDGQFAITNQEKLLEYWLNPTDKTKTDKLPGNILYLTTALLNSTSEQTVRTTEFFSFLSQTFKAISINNGVFFSTIHLTFHL